MDFSSDTRDRAIAAAAASVPGRGGADPAPAVDPEVRRQQEAAAAYRAVTSDAPEDGPPAAAGTSDADADEDFGFSDSEDDGDDGGAVAGAAVAQVPDAVAPPPAAEPDADAVRLRQYEEQLHAIAPLMPLYQAIQANPGLEQVVVGAIADHVRSQGANAAQAPPAPELIKAPDNGWASDTEEVLAAELNREREARFGIEQKLGSIEAFLVGQAQSQRSQQIAGIVPQYAAHYQQITGLPQAEADKFAAKLAQALSAYAPYPNVDLKSAAEGEYKKLAFDALIAARSSAEGERVARAQQGAIKPRPASAVAAAPNADAAASSAPAEAPSGPYANARARAMQAIRAIRGRKAAEVNG